MVGLGLVTNYRGFADTFARHAYVPSLGLRRRPPWKWKPERPDELARQAKRVRLMAIPFAVVGPIVTIVGVLQIVRGHIAIPNGPVLPLPFSLAFIGIAAVAIGQYWRRGGFFRVAAEQGRWMRVAAIAASAGGVSFGLFTAVGQMTLGVAGWLVGGLASVSLLMSRKPADPSPQDSANCPGAGDEGPRSR